MDHILSPGKWVKLRRKSLDMTQAGLAAASSCSVETIRKIESDALRPSRQLADLLADSLQIAPAERADFVRFVRAFPAPSSSSSGIASPYKPGNLRPSATPFIGREREVARVRDLLHHPEVRLLTLSGPPGIGKTRLSIEAASGVEGFPDGVFFVPLAAVRDPDLLLPSIAAGLGVRETGSRPLPEVLKSYLQSKTLLLVLDNFEQIVEAGPLLSDLLLSASGVKMLVSSRAVLRIYGEHNFVVPPMSVPSQEEHTDAYERLSQYEAVRLFVSRAQAAQPGFALTEANVSAVAEICRLLDGLPLAIELAAGRSRTLSPHDLLARLGSRLDLLSSGMSDLPPRQQTLRGAIAWSDSLMTEEERAVFRRFAVFSAGSTLDAAEAICAQPGAPELNAALLSLLESLIDKSLLRRDDASGELRFWMLETIREYAQEKLDEACEGAATRHAHIQYYLALAERAEGELQSSRQAEWLADLESELGNLRVAMRNALDVGDVPDASRLGSALRRFWYLHGHITEGRRWLEEIASRADALPVSLRAKTMHALGTLAWSQGDYPTARSMFEQGLGIRRQLGDTQGVAEMLNNLAVAALPRGDLDEAQSLNEEALALFRELGDRWSESMSLANLGLVATNRGDYDSAEQLLSDSLRIRRALGDKQSIAQSLNNLGTVLRLKGDPESAYELHSEALTIFEGLDDTWSIALSQANMGAAQLSRGEYVEASGLLHDALRAFAELDVKQGVATCLEYLAGVAARTGKPDHAARLFGAAEALREEIGVPTPPSDGVDYARNVQIARDAAVPSRFATSWALGRAMSQEDAVAFALAGR